MKRERSFLTEGIQMQTTLRQVLSWLEVNNPRFSEEILGITVQGVSTDTRTLKPGNLFIPLVGERFDGHAFISDAVDKGACAVLCEAGRTVPNVQCPVIYVTDTLHALQKLAHRYRKQLDVQVIAVTGSNGKTTTKDLIARVLSEKFTVHKTEGNLNNHIGLPLTLLAMPAKTGVAVVEMGMNHPGEIAQLSRIAEPDVAIVTNIGEAHMAFFKDRRDIARAKLEIIEGLAPDGTIFVNGDDALLVEAVRDVGREFKTIGLQSHVDERAIDVHMNDDGFICFTAVQDDYRYELSLFGVHNVLNALFALAVGRLMGLSSERMSAALKTVQPTAGRLQLKKTARGLWILDDSYNANPTAMKAGIETLISLADRREKWVLLGDILELGDKEETMHRDIGRFIAKKPLDRIYIVGPRGKWIYEEVVQHVDNPSHVVYFSDVDEVIHAFQQFEAKNVVLYVKASRALALERVVDTLCKTEVV